MLRLPPMSTRPAHSFPPLRSSALRRLPGLQVLRFGRRRRVFEELSVVVGQGRQDPFLLLLFRDLEDVQAAGNEVEGAVRAADQGPLPPLLPRLFLLFRLFSFLRWDGVFLAHLMQLGRANV